MHSRFAYGVSLGKDMKIVVPGQIATIDAKNFQVTTGLVKKTGSMDLPIIEYAIFVNVERDGETVLHWKADVEVDVQHDTFEISERTK